MALFSNPRRGVCQRMTPSTLGSFDSFDVGQVFHSRGRTISDADIRLFIGSTGADHPNHTDAQYCEKHPFFAQPCAPGVQILGVVDGHIAEAITRRVDLSLNYGHDRIRYLKPVYPGDTISSTVTIIDARVKDPEWGVLTVEAHAQNQRGELVLVNVNRLLIRRNVVG